VLLNVGFSRTNWSGLTLPFPLGGIGMTGCSLLAAPDVAFALANQGGTAAWSVLLPNDPGLVGVSFYNQGFVLDPGANPLGVTATGGGCGTIGAK
jgi:hypothetical protein